MRNDQLLQPALAHTENIASAFVPGERSCCCPSRPMVRVVLPPTPERDHPVDLLLCGHHLRESAAIVALAGTQVFDSAGVGMYSGDANEEWLYASTPASSAPPRPDHPVGAVSG